MGKPSDYNYISEFQEELILQKLHLRGLFRKVHFLEILENPQTRENKAESDHFLEILENLEILEILAIAPVKRPLL